jgi:hypothetical protein
MLFYNIGTLFHKINFFNNARLGACILRQTVRAGHSLIFSRFAIRSPLYFFPWIADAHAFIFLISLVARRSNARRSTSGSLSEKGLNHSSLSIILSYFYIFFAKLEFSRGFLYISLISGEAVKE